MESGQFQLILKQKGLIPSHTVLLTYLIFTQASQLRISMNFSLVNYNYLMDSRNTFNKDGRSLYLTHISPVPNVALCPPIPMPSWPCYLGTERTSLPL